MKDIQKMEKQLKRTHPLPNTLTFINCSDINMKSCVTVLKGNIDRDDTWVDIIFIDGKNNDSLSLNIQDFKEE